jgi:hypothetical protein
MKEWDAGLKARSTRSTEIPKRGVNTSAVLRKGILYLKHLQIIAEVMMGSARKLRGP